MEFCRAESNLGWHLVEASTFTIFEARSDLGDYDIAPLKVCQPCTDILYFFLK